MYQVSSAQEHVQEPSYICLHKKCTAVCRRNINKLCAILLRRVLFINLETKIWVYYWTRYSILRRRFLIPKFKRVSLNEIPEFSFFGVFTFCRFWFKRFDKNGKYKQTFKKNISLQKYWYSQNCLTPFA